MHGKQLGPLGRAIAENDDVDVVDQMYGVEGVVDEIYDDDADVGNFDIPETECPLDANKLAMFVNTVRKSTLDDDRLVCAQLMQLASVTMIELNGA